MHGLRMELVQIGFNNTLFLGPAVQNTTSGRYLLYSQTRIVVFRKAANIGFETSQFL